MNVISSLAEKNVCHILDKIFHGFTERDILNVAHVSKSWRSIVDNFALFELLEYDAEVDIEFEKEIKFCGNKLMIRPDTIVQHFYEKRRINMILTKLGPFTETTHDLKKVMIYLIGYDYNAQTIFESLLPF